MKTCSKCKETKPADAFHKRTKASDGLAIWCRECVRINHRAHYLRKCRDGKSAAHGNLRHGYARVGQRSPEHVVWYGMIERCHNERHISYKYYGAKGVSVAPEWRADFMAFLAHVGPRPTKEHSIDRIRFTGNYEPGNVKWSTEKQQQRNRSSNKLTIYDARLIRHWCKKGYEPITIARAFGVTSTMICRIRNNQAWMEE